MQKRCPHTVGKALPVSPFSNKENTQKKRNILGAFLFSYCGQDRLTCPLSGDGFFGAGAVAAQNRHKIACNIFKHIKYL